MISSHDLAAFVTFSDCGSLRKAADTLNRTQPAVSQAIQRLEDSVGFPLLDRSGYRAQLTEKGGLFLKRARRLVNDNRELQAYADVLASDTEAQLRMAVHGAVPPEVWLTLVKMLPESFPDTVLEVRSTEGNAPFRQLAADEVDMAVVVGSITGASRLDFDYQKIADLAFVTVVNSRFTESNLSRLPQILVADFADEQSQFGVVEGQRFWRVSDFRSKAEAIVGGLGWGTLPRYLAEDYLQQGRIQQVRYHGMGPESVHPVYLCRRHGVLAGPVAENIWNRFTQ